MSSKSRKDLENWVKTIKNIRGNVLDIGGSQNPILTRIDKSQWYADQYAIMDLKTPHEVKQSPDFECDVQSEGVPQGYFGFFDVAFCLEVMEYVFDPMQAMENMNKYLKKGGVLYISFHTLYGLHNPKGEDCLRYTKNAIFKLATAAGFEITELVTKKLTPEGRTHYFKFCYSEGMRLDYRHEDTYDEGYLVTMKKL